MSKKKNKRSGDSSTSLIIQTSKKSKGFRIPEGIYTAKLDDVEFTDGQYGKQIVWTFKIIKGKKKGRPLKMWSDIKANPKNKTGKAIKAIGNNRKITDGDFNLRKLIKRKCKLLVADHKNKAGEATSKIESVLPYDLDDDED